MNKPKYRVFPVILLVVIALQGFSPNRNSSGQFADSKGRLSDTVKKDAGWPATFGLGRLASQEEIARIDIDVRPDGKGLPVGSGNARGGQAIYQAKCIACHGGRAVRTANASLPGPALITDSLSGSRVKTIGNYWPYASTVYDYINRSMPYNAPGSLTPNEVYSLTAYLLFANRIIKEDEVLNAKTLPKIVMPAEKLFVPDDRTGGPVIR